MTILPRTNKITFQKITDNREQNILLFVLSLPWNKNVMKQFFLGENDFGIFFVHYGQISSCIPESYP